MTVSFNDDCIRDTLIKLLEWDRIQYYEKDQHNTAMLKKIKDLEDCLYKRYSLIIENPYEKKSVEQYEKKSVKQLELNFN